nr:E3 ubiquitin protein ligase hyd [Hymenolepis microstoma]
MSYPHFFVSKKHKDGVSQVQLQLDLYELLKNIGDSIKKDGVFVPEVLRPLVDYIILETVVGPSHLAFLLNDGRVCRVAFSLLEDKLVFLSERKKGRNPDIGRDSSLSRDGNSGSARSSGNAAALRSLRGSMSVMGRPRGSLNILRDLQRGGSMYFRPPIAASEIPEEFIEQCQMVLQGKSRQAIVRELQRTNLDVNAAVNNLLSREDESDFNNASGPPGFDDDWGDDTMDVFSILQQSEGLLMENEGDIPDEFIDRTAVPRFRREILMDCDRSLGDHATYTDRRKRRRFESNLLRNSENFRSGESGRSIWPYLGISDDKEEEINQDGSTGKGAVSYIQLGDRLEFWTTISAESPPSHFTAIAALYTELVAINSRGELHQWKWQSPEPYNPHNIYSQPFNLDQPESGHTVNHRHPRAANLGISHEKIISLSGCITRASIITSSGAVATWVDEILTALFHSIVPASSAVLNAASLALSRLEHPATYFSELKNEKVVHLSVAPLISVVQCASGDVYWWGVLPSYIRQKNADKQKNITGSTITTNETTRHQTASEGPEVAAKITNAPSLNPGDLVCMRNAPMFHAGAVGFTLINGIPKVGVLLEDSWKLTDVCRFRVKSPSSLKSFPTEKLHVTISGKSSNSASTEAAHALICPYAQEIAAAYAAAAASQGEHESTQLDTGSVEMPPPPSPASSTCSDQSGPVKVSPGTFKTVVGPSHLAFLLNDGRVCRVAFSLLEDKLVFLSERKKGRNPDIGRDSSLSRDGNSGSARSSGNAAALRSLRGSMSVMGRPRGSLNILRDLQRGGSMYFRPPIAASEIPEEFIEQCQMVLQGKSRQAIVRELQRTNLDVNAAVNNLLSREDESDFNNASGPPGFDDDWGDDTMDVFSILQQSEGLLMENEGDIPDEFIDRTAVPRFRREILMDCDRSLGDHATYTDRRKRRRFESNLLRNSENFRSGESGRSIWPYLGISDDKEEEINQDGSTGKGAVSYIQLGDRLEFWTTISAESPPSHFTAIAALYTELVAINSRGELHQWKWQSPEPYNPHNIYSQPFNLDQPESGHTVNHRHPRAANLGISHEKIISLSGCITRASIITSSGAVATWVDEILTALFHSIVPASSAVLNAASLALSRLEHPATYFSELKNEKVVHLSVAPLISVVQCASGDVYWWGVLPSYIRQKNADKQKNITGSTITTNETTRHQTASEGPEVAAKITNAPSLNPGDLVCMRNAPMFHAGAVGFTLINGIPKVGVLLEDSWKLTDVCRFRVKSPSSLKSFPTEKLHVTISGKSSNSASTEAAHALICPYAQEIAAAYAAAAASQGEHESTQLDTGSVEMPPPPSPASSTCSDQSGPVKVSPGTFKRKKVPSNSSDSGNLPSTSRSDSLQQSVPSASQQPSTKQQPFASKSSGQSKISHDEEIEDWCLSDVHFVEDGRNQPVGVLMKLDGNIAAVKFLKEQDRACLAARCPASPVCQFINYISKSGTNATVGKPFPVPGTTSSQSSSACVLQDPFFWINDCRLLNKSDIVQVKQPSGGGLPQRVPDFVQPTPRYITMGFLASKLPTPAHSNSSTNVIKKKIISLAPENSRIHAIVGRCSTDDLATAAMCHLEYHVFTLNGKTVSSRRLPALANKAGIHLDGGSEDSSSYSNITLTSPSERPLLLRDSAGVVFPFLPPSRPGQESWVFPPWLDLPPVQCAALAWINTSRNSSSASSQDRKLSVSEGDTRNTGTGNASVDKKSSSVPTRLQNDSRLLFGVVVTRETSLLQHIIRTDEVKVEETLRSLAAAAPSRLETIACEMADGHRTILHMAVLMCAPLVRETQEMTNVIENILKRTSTDGSTADGSGWTTIPPSSTQQPSSSLPKSIQSILNLRAVFVIIVEVFLISISIERKKVPSNSSDSGNLPSTSRSDSLQQSVPSASQQPSTKQQPFASKSSGQSKISHDEEIEDWCLSDVHFVEDGRNQPVGVLMKLDGNIAAVKFLKEQDRACLAARCPASPVCQFINYISKSGTNATVGKPFPVPGTTSSQSSSACVLQDPFFWINDCRLLNKSDIVQVKQPSGGGLPQRVPDFVQPTPRYITMGFLASKLPTPAHSNSSTNVIKKKIISLAPENSRIHAIVGRCSTDDLATAAMCHLEYHVFTLNGKTVSSRRLPALANKAGIHLDGGSEDSSSYSNITLTSPSERPLLLRDSAGVVFPFLPPSRPGQESWVFPPWLDLPPVQCAALAWINTSRNSSSASSQDRKLSVSEGDTRNTGTGNASVDKKSSSVPTRLQNDSRLLFGVVVTRETSLLQHIIRTDEVKVEETLRSLAAAAPSRLETIACEMADGHRTILHMAVLMCAPLVRETQEMTNVIENILKRTSTDGSTADGSGWTTIPPSSTQQPSSSLPKSIQSILNLAPGAQRSSSAGSTSSSIHDFFIRSSIEAAAAASSGTSGATTETTLTPSNSYFCHLPSLTSVEESSRRPAAHRIFRALMDNKRLRRLMPKLLSSLSDDSLTPFMLAVQCKAYQVAQYILDFLIEMEGIRSDGSEESRYQFRYARLMRYLYPSSARLDDSPLFNLAYNDTCSFTWTGPKHIRQDIFECRTCGLMDSLCCCSECARVCHKGHDCRLKRTSPTAYCDCWEKCRCRSLISGHQDIRKELFKRLLDYTDMVYLPNRLNDHLLVYLTRRVVRQWKEQKQFKSMRRHGGGGERNRGAGGNSPNSDEPEHDLDPPVFSRQALEITLDSKAAVASLLCDCKQVFLSYPHGRYEDKKNKSADSPCVQAIQSGTAILDEFVFLLICKYPAEFVQRLVNTLARTLSEHLNGDSGVRQLMTLTFSSNPPPNTSNNAFYYCQKGIARFVRSVARIYTGLMLSLAPDHNKKKSRINGSQANTLELIRSIFSQLAPVALPELTALATKIISPVRTGALLSTRPFELSSQLQDAIHASYNQFSFEQLISSEKSGNNSRSRQAQSNVPFYHSSGHGPDCPNIVIRHLIYGFDGSDGTSSAILPTWINIKRQLTPVASTSEQKSEQAMEVDDPPSLTSRSKRRRQESINSDSPQTKHRRRHHRKRHRHGDSNASTGGSDPPAPPPSQPPVIVVEPVATTVTNTSNASNTFAEMELTVPGDSDTDGDVRSNELDSNATTTVEPHQHRMEEEYFSETASEDETISRSQLEAPGSQHSSISSTAATAGTTGSVILDSLDTSRREQQNESTANTTLEEGESTMIVTPYCGSDEEEDEMMAEEGNANAQGMQGLAASIRRSISRRQNREERRRQQQRRFASINDDDEVANEDTEEEDDESDMSGEEGDEEISVESGEDSEDSDDSESDSESDDSDEEEGDVEGEDESVSETEEEDEEEDMEEEEVERDLSVMDDDDNEQENERDDDEEAYSQESDSSPPPSPWIRRRLGGGGSGAGGQAGQGSSSTTATTQGGGNGNAGGAGEVSSANTSQNLTPTTATTSVSRPISSSGSVMARLYSAALSSAFDRRNVRGTSLNALNGWTPFGAPLSPSPTDPSTAPVGSNTNSSSNAVTSAATTANNNNSEAQANPDANEMKNGGIHVTEVQLSRAMGTLLRLIADVMADLVNQDGENVEEEGDDTDGHLRRSVSAPVLLTPPVGMVVPRKWRALTRNRGGMVQTPTGCILTPLRSLVVARPADSVGRALICAGVGSILEPIWDWISECLCDLEARLRARASWNEIRPDIPAVEFFSGDYGKSKPRKDITITGPHQNVKSSQNQGSTVGPTESAILIGSSEGDSGIVAIETTTEGGGPMKGSANRAQTLNYVISLMRSLHNEHDSHVPAVDISSYKHSAYIVDAFIYFFRVFEGTWPSGLSYHLVRHRDSLPESMQVVDEFSQLRSRLFQGHPLTQRTHSFFRRSMSTLCINAPPVDAILNPAAESLPLAVTPQVLEPEAERSTYFSVDKNNKIYSDFSKLEEDAHSSLAKDSRPQHSSRIGKNVNFEQRIICGGEFLDSVCHTGSTMMRWSRSLNAFASAFSTDISVEPRSYMVERLSFTAKEARFRKDMERLRSCTKYDLSLEIDRDPSALILNTATQLNNELSSRLAQSAAYGNSLLMRDSGSVSDLLRFHHETAAIASGAISPQVSSNLLNFPSSSSSGIPVLLSRRVKVVFRGEPGEGSGVTRSFISSFAEAVTADTHLPDLSPLYLNAISRNVHQEALNNPRAATPTSLMVAATSRLFNRLRIPLSSNSNSTTFASSTANNAVTTMTATTGSGSNITQATNTSSSSVPSGSAAAVSRSRRSEIQAMRNYFRSPYTSISINLATPMNTQSEEPTESNISPEPTAITMPVATTETVETTTAPSAPGVSPIDSPERDPLLWQPGHSGFFSPRGIPSNLSPDSPAFRARMDLYRCIGRVVALSLLHSEICPISFNRHVLKYILGRPLCWHDFAFYNVDLFEGLRQVLLPVARGENSDIVSDFGLNFSLVLAPEEGGNVANPSLQLHQLVSGGDGIDVDAETVFEYVKRYAEFKMLDVAKDALEQIRLGVFDVLPVNALDGLTPEDLRLLLNGITDIDVDMLSGYTTFIDESNCGASLATEGGGQQGGGGSDSGTDYGGTAPNIPNPAKDRIERLKRWFWHVVRGMNPRQRQDLLYFWTSSPALPPSALGFEPSPTIVIRPADDQHLPTANTCISRLYLPLYSSRQILREKLLSAIETRSFGFV